MTATSYAPVTEESRHSVRRAPTLLSPETKSLLTLGKQRGWEFSVLGQAPMPLAPVQVGNWLVVPAHQDTSHIPVGALERLNAIREAGLRPKGFVLVHELPKSLPGSVQPQAWRFRFPALSPVVKTILAVSGLILAIPVIAAGLLAVVAAVASLLATVLVPLLIFGALLALDPILVAVTDDDFILARFLVLNSCHRIEKRR